MPSSDPYSIRFSEETEERLFEVIRACSGECRRSDIIRKSVDIFLRMLPACPEILEGYDKAKDQSVIQKTGGVAR